MNSPLVTVRLHGSLAAITGREEYKLAITSPAEALQAIDANTDGKLLSGLLDNWSSAYSVFVNGKPVRDIEEMAVLQRSNLTSVEFMPVFQGSGGMSGWMVLAGILLIAFVFIAPYLGVGLGLKATAATATTAAVSATGATIGTMLVGMGLSLVLSGVVGLLSPSNKFDSNERPENRPSYIFSGAVNTYKQGNPIPVGFGMLRVGSQIVAAGVRALNVDTNQE